MSAVSSTVSRRQTGFTLIEVLVAIAIMALSLSLLYQILGSNTQAVSLAGQYQRASMLAQSLLNAQDAVAASGWNDQGESAGFVWQVSSRPYETPAARSMQASTPLHQIDILVSWNDGLGERHIALSTLRPQRLIPQTSGALPEE